MAVNHFCWGLGVVEYINGGGGLSNEFQDVKWWKVLKFCPLLYSFQNITSPIYSMYFYPNYSCPTPVIVLEHLVTPFSQKSLRISLCLVVLVFTSSVRGSIPSFIHYCLLIILTTTSHVFYSDLPESKPKLYHRRRDDFPRVCTPNSYQIRPWSHHWNPGWAVYNNSANSWMPQVPAQWLLNWTGCLSSWSLPLCRWHVATNFTLPPGPTPCNTLTKLW
jgi:hypothetical protein